MTSSALPGFGHILLEMSEGPFWKRSIVHFCENGLSRLQGDQETAIVDFRTTWSYTERVTHNNRNFAYINSDYAVSVYGAEQKARYKIFESFHKDKQAAEWIGQCQDYFREALGKFTWPNAQKQFMAGEYVECGSLGISKSEIDVDGNVLFVNEFDGIIVNQGRLLFEHVAPDTKRTTIAKVDVGKVENYYVALALLSELKPVEGRKRSWYQGWFGIN